MCSHVGLRSTVLALNGNKTLCILEAYNDSTNATVKHRRNECFPGGTDSPHFFRRLHRRELDRHHAIHVGLADQVGLGAEDVGRGHGSHTVLQTAGAVAAVGQQEGVLCLRLKPRNQFLRQFAVHLPALPVVVQDLDTRNEIFRLQGYLTLRFKTLFIYLLCSLMKYFFLQAVEKMENA